MVRLILLVSLNLDFSQILCIGHSIRLPIIECVTAQRGTGLSYLGGRGARSVIHESDPEPVCYMLLKSEPHSYGACFRQGFNLSFGAPHGEVAMPRLSPRVGVPALTVVCAAAGAMRAVCIEARVAVGKPPAQSATCALDGGAAGW